jgi:DNA-binding transcriptional MerR regulator
MRETAKPLRSGELARLTGVSTDTLRHYERLGILPATPRTQSGYRMYAPDAPVRVNLARQAMRLGFTLKELVEILHARDRGDVPCRRVLAMAEAKLSALEQKIQELRQAQSAMQALVQEWRARLERTPRGTKAGLLQSLASRPNLPSNLQSKPSDRLIRRRQA